MITKHNVDGLGTAAGSLFFVLAFTMTINGFLFCKNYYHWCEKQQLPRETFLLPFLLFSVYGVLLVLSYLGMGLTAWNRRLGKGFYFFAWLFAVTPLFFIVAAFLSNQSGITQQPFTWYWLRLLIPVGMLPLLYAARFAMRKSKEKSPWETVQQWATKTGLFFGTVAVIALAFCMIQGRLSEEAANQISNFFAAGGFYLCGHWMSGTAELHLVDIREEERKAARQEQA